MIHILLLLLKIIGITLLSLVGLLVLIILLVLFVPVRYALRAEADERITVRVRASWLFRLLYAGAVYDETFGIVIRVFGIPIKRIPAPEKPAPPKKKAKRKKGKRTRREPAEDTPSADGTGEASESKTAVSAEMADTMRADTHGNAEDGADTDTGDSTGGNAGISAEPDQDAEKAEKTSFLQKLIRFFRAVRAFFSKILYTIRNICDKIEEIKELIGYYSEVLRSEEGRNTFALAKRELGRLFRHIAPTKLNGSLTIGMDDPAVTGQIIAVISMFYPIYGNNVSITPDFDEKCMRGNLYLKGRIRLITLIRIAWRVYFNKDIKKFLHMLKREENEA